MAAINEAIQNMPVEEGRDNEFYQLTSEAWKIIERVCNLPHYELAMSDYEEMKAIHKKLYQYSFKQYIQEAYI